MRSIVVAATLAAVVFAVGCQREPTPEETTVTSVGQIAPAFAVKTLDGETFDLAALRGRVVLVNFWATWCPPCREEIPHLETGIWQRFKERDFAMVAISREEDEAAVRPFTEAHTMNFPVAIDSDRSIYRLYAESFIPRNIVIGPEGSILFQSSGYDSEEFTRMVTVIEGALPTVD